MKKQYAWDQVGPAGGGVVRHPSRGGARGHKAELLEEFLGVVQSAQRVHDEGLGDFWEQDFRRFDPALSPFSKFLLSRLKLRVRDGVREDLGRGG